MSSIKKILNFYFQFFFIIFMTHVRIVRNGRYVCAVHASYKSSETEQNEQDAFLLIT